MINAVYINEADIMKPLLCLFSVRNIDVGEELTFSYVGTVDEVRAHLLACIILSGLIPYVLHLYIPGYRETERREILPEMLVRVEEMLWPALHIWRYHL